MTSKHQSHKAIGAGTDEILFALCVPGDTLIESIRAEVNVQKISRLPVESAAQYMVEGYILPVLDPDNTATIDTIWDQLVPKDTDETFLDLDATGAVSGESEAPFSEPGEPDWATVMDVGLRPRKIFGRDKMLTAASHDTFYDSSDLWFHPRDVFHIDIGTKMWVSQPSVIAFGLGSPNLDDTTTTVATMYSQTEWGQIKYAEQMLENAMLEVLGITGAATNDPWEAAVAILQKHLEPDVVEETSGRFASNNLEAFSQMEITHSVPGRMAVGTLTSGR